MFYRPATKWFPVPAVLLTLTLTSCGGSGGRSGTSSGSKDLWTVGTIKGSVDLSRTRAAGIPTKIRTLVGTAPIASDGSFSVKGLPNGPALAFLLDDGENVVGTAFIEAKNARIDAALQARSLAFMAMKGQYLIPETRKLLWEGLKAAPEVAAIANDLSALPGGLSANGPAVKASIHDHLEPMLARMTREPSRGIKVDPSNGKSGVEVLQQGLDAIVVKNHFRRRAWAFVERVQYTPAEGDPVNVRQPVDNFAVDPITNPASISAAVADAGNILGDSNPQFTGNVAWAPTTTSPLNLAILPTESRGTKYRVVVVGPGLTTNAPRPLTDGMTAKWRELLATSFALDIFFPALLTYGAPMLDDRLSNFPDPDDSTGFRNYLLICKEMLSAMLADPGVEAKADAGDYAGAWGDMMSLIVASDSYKTLWIEAWRAAIIWRMGNPSPEVLENINRFSRGMTDALQGADFVLQGLDYAMIFSHWGSSKGYEEFFVDVTKAKVRLNPQAGVLSVTQSMPLQATVPDATGEEAPLIAYHWKILSGSGVQLRSATQTGSDFTSSSGDVNLESLNHQVGTVRVQVEAIRDASGTANDLSLGTAEATIEVVNDKAVLAPDVASIRPNGSQAFTVRINDPRPNSRYMFKWSATNTHGSINAGTEMTANRTVTFTAGGAEGSDTITVEAYQQSSAGYIRIGTATSRVLVEQVPTIIPATFAAKTGGSGDRGRVVAVVSFDKVPGAKSYRLVGTGGYDSAFFGDHISFNTSGTVNEPENGIVAPDSQIWVGLSGWDGPASGTAGAVSWMQSRFGGFAFHVEVTK